MNNSTNKLPLPSNLLQLYWYTSKNATTKTLWELIIKCITFLFLIYDVSFMCKV